MKKPKVDIVVPTYNEAEHIEKNVKLIYDTLKKQKLDFDWKITIAENGSKDNTFELAKKLANKHREIKAVHFDRGSKDNALIETWSKSKADIVMFTDADISAHPKFIPDLIRPLIEENYDITIGSRFISGSVNDRGFYRDSISKIYNRILLPLILPTGVKDAQCGFKAVKKEVVRKIIPKMQRLNGFFDSELLGVAHHQGFRVKEVPVTWQETRKSVLSVNKNIPNFLKNILKTRKKIMSGYYD